MTSIPYAIAVIACAAAAWDGWRRWLEARAARRTSTEEMVSELPERFAAVQRSLDVLASEVQCMGNKIGLMVRK